MKLHQLPKITLRSKKRAGRGYGSGKGGHTVGRGQKGQKSRSKVKLLFEGTKTRKSFLRRMPMLRGKGKVKSLKKKPIIINLQDLGRLSGAKVTIDSLVKAGLVKIKEAKARGVKILSKGEVVKKFRVSLPVSQKAREKIEKIGGKIEAAQGKPAVKKIKQKT